MKPSTAVLTIRNVARIHGNGESSVHALRGVSLTIRAGELVAVMGQSGSGKSTLLRIAGGLDSPTSGSVRVLGSPVEEMKSSALARMRRRSVGYVFQDYNLINSLTALENVTLPLELDGVKSRQARIQSRIALEQVGIGGMADRYPHQMSGGQQQRVAIARAVVGDRSLLLADEPTGALDNETGAQVLEVLRSRCAAGTAAMLVTHEARHAVSADRVIVLRDGVIVDESTGAGFARMVANG